MLPHLCYVLAYCAGLQYIKTLHLRMVFLICAENFKIIMVIAKSSIILSSQQSASFYDFHAIIPLISSLDPISGEVGSGLVNRMEGRKRYGRKKLKAKHRWEPKVRFERKAEVTLYHHVLRGRLANSKGSYQ